MHNADEIIFKIKLLKQQFGAGAHHKDETGRRLGKQCKCIERIILGMYLDENVILKKTYRASKQIEILYSKKEISCYKMLIKENPF